MREWFPANLHYSRVLNKYIDENDYKKFKKYLKEM